MSQIVENIASRSVEEYFKKFPDQYPEAIDFQNVSFRHYITSLTTGSRQ